MLSDNEAVDEAIEFEPGDVLGKALALITQIRSSPQAKSYFAKVCVEEGLKPLELIKWVRTRWGSMFDLIDRLILDKRAVNKFCLVADTCGQVPKLQNKAYSDYYLTSAEWTLLELMREVLQEPRDAQASFSSETAPTVWRTIPILECLQEHWEIMAKTSKFRPVKLAIEKGLAKLNKWYKAIDETDVYFICLGEVFTLSH
ncbi:hypothetical protein BYT27DRAFT_7342075 [Phlegmacium glaucopus]|nr:hypothetical protein BYT27DRAFT_7342075 [Phlegmacium glaucopus]